MDCQLWIVYAPLPIIAIGWLSVISTSGYVVELNENGFTFRSWMRRRRFVRWDSVADPVKHVHGYSERIGLRSAAKRFVDATGLLG